MTEDNGQTWSVDDLFAEAKPVRAKARVLLDADLLAQLDDLEDQLRTATLAAASDDDSLAAVPKAEQIARRILELQGQARASERVFVFQSIGYRRWRDLELEHPPTPEQLNRDPNLDVNPETFTSVAIAASCVQPVGMTLEKAQQLEQILTRGQYLQLWAACAAANNRGSQIPNSQAASDALRRLEQTSRARPTTGSP